MVWTLLSLSPLWHPGNGTQVPGLTGMCWQDLAPQPASLPCCRPSAPLWGLPEDLGMAALQSMGDLLYSAASLQIKGCSWQPTLPPSDNTGFCFLTNIFNTCII